MIPRGDLELEGRIVSASNATFVGRIDGVQVVYKPVRGERPLWDFPGAVLANREFATFLVSEAFGWDLVPTTWLGEGPHGPGMLQLWQDVTSDAAVTLVPAAEGCPSGWCSVLEGLDADNQRVLLVHDDSRALRRMAVLDVVVNNADRKGGHVLPVTAGHRYGVDHGLTFHLEPKLRTVLWGWVDMPLNDDEIDGVQQVRAAVDGDLGRELAVLLADEEIDALAARCERLLDQPRFPAPEGDMPAVPWPPF